LRHYSKVLAVFQAHRGFAAIPELRRAVGELRDDPDTDVSRAAKRCASEELEYSNGLTGIGMTGLRLTP
jgi:hypothetical protein